MDCWTKCLESLPSFNVGDISNWIGTSSKALNRGYKFFIEEYLKEISTKLNENGEFLCKAACYRSQRRSEKPHDVETKINVGSKEVMAANCSCVAGRGGKCSHVAALLYKLHHFHVQGIKEIPTATSCTSQEQKWHKPRGEVITAEPLMQCIFAKADTDHGKQRLKSPIKTRLYDARGIDIRGPLSESEITKIKSSSSSSAPFSYLLNRPSHQENTFVETIFGAVGANSPLSYQLQDFGNSSKSFQFISSNVVKSLFQIKIDKAVMSPSLPVAPLNIDFENFMADLPTYFSNFLQKLSISLEEAHIVEKQTTTQNDTPLWHEQRRFRLTSSNFGKVLNRKSEPSTSFLQNIFYAPNLDHVKSIRHGHVTEKTALKAYAKHMKVELCRDVDVFPCGLVLNPGISFLGSTPDGKVVDKFESRGIFGLVEVKCPYKYRNADLKEAALIKDFYLHFDNDVLKLKSNHEYYYQIQGQLAISGLQWCDFVVSTSQSMFVQRIHFDIVLWSQFMLPHLSTFYFEYALPFLTKQMDSSSSQTE